MSCVRGCCATQREHYQSVCVTNPDAPDTKTKTDDHGTHTVDVIEHRDGRVDVTVHAPPPITAKLAVHKTG